MHATIKELVNTSDMLDGSARPVQRLNAFRNQRTTKYIDHFRCKSYANCSAIFPWLVATPPWAMGHPWTKTYATSLKLCAYFARNRHHRTAISGHAQCYSYDIRFRRRICSNIEEILNTSLMFDGSAMPVQKWNAFKIHRIAEHIAQFGWKSDASARFNAFTNRRIPKHISCLVEIVYRIRGRMRTHTHERGFCC